MPEIITSTILRARMKDALLHVKEHKQPLVITERGTATSVLLDLDTYEDYLLLQDKQAVKELQASVAQKQRGEVVPFADVFADVL